MSITASLLERSQSTCELCGSSAGLVEYGVPHSPSDQDGLVCLCEKCHSHITGTNEEEANHWRCLSESMWSEYPAVQVLSWIVLDSLKSESWALDLKEQLYLDDSLLNWALANQTSMEDTITVKDSNGALLKDGDSVTLIKDLEVKGAGFTAKRGTLVKKISLTDNPEQIEGRVNGTQIVLVTKYLKKA